MHLTKNDALRLAEEAFRRTNQPTMAGVMRLAAEQAPEPDDCECEEPWITEPEWFMHEFPHGTKHYLWGEMIGGDPDGERVQLLRWCTAAWHTPQISKDYLEVEKQTEARARFLLAYMNLRETGDL